MNKNKRKNKRISLIFLLLILGAGGYFANVYYQRIMVVNIDTSGEDKFLYISKGAVQEDVLQQLTKLNVVKDVESLEWLAERKNYNGKNIVPGKYKIRGKLSNNELINHLRAGNGKLDVKLRFGQFRNIKQLSSVLSENIELDSTAIHEWLSNSDSISKYGFNPYTIVCMFIPNTYFVDWEISVPNLMKRMANEYNRFWNSGRKEKAKEMGLSQSEVVSLASLVYWETKDKEDIPKVAGVYMNRLKIGMPLQSDPTLIFALDDYSIRRVLNVHKEIDSPYNTYKNRGLPPGPILIPPISFVDAVLNYAKHDYLYFVAKEDFSGKSYFAESHAQHIVYAKRFQKALNQRGIYR